MARTARKCSTMSVCSDRITHSSSATPPRSGNSSLIMRPDCPQARNGNGEPSSGRLLVSSARSPNEGTGLPLSLLNLGLWSKVST